MNDIADLDLLELDRFAIGQPVPRSEDPVLVTGKGRFTDDVNLPGQAYAEVVRSHHAHGLIRDIDAAAARGIDIADEAMRMVAAHDFRIGLAGQVDVIGKPACARYEHWIFAARYWLADRKPVQFEQIQIGDIVHFFLSCQPGKLTLYRRDCKARARERRGLRAIPEPLRPFAPALRPLR